MSFRRRVPVLAWMQGIGTTVAGRPGHMSGGTAMDKADLDGKAAKPNAERRDEDETVQMAELGVAFDGRCYWYHEYRYELLPDALNYARIDRARPTYEPKIYVYPEWRPPEKPSAEQQRAMSELGVSFDGKHYRYREYRYDHLADAINYARLQK